MPRARLQPSIGFAASLLAVCCQILLLATISLAPLAIGAAPLDGAPICHADDGTSPARHAPGRPAHNCALCAICLAQVLPLAMPTPAPMLPERPAVAATQSGTVQLRAPPVRLVAAAQPRGPPALI